MTQKNFSRRLFLETQTSPISGVWSCRKEIYQKKPVQAENLLSCLKFLEEDAFHNTLRTHKLTGVLSGSWAASAGYDLRIIFRFVQHEGAEAILLETVGTHDEVY